MHTQCSAAAPSPLVRSSVLVRCACVACMHLSWCWCVQLQTCSAAFEFETAQPKRPGPAWPRHACTIYATTGVRSRVVWCARGIHIRTCSTRRTCTDEAAAAHGAQTAGSKGRLYYSTYYLKCGFGYQLGVMRLQASQVQRDACIGTYLCIWIPAGRNTLFKMFLFN